MKTRFSVYADDSDANVEQYKAEVAPVESDPMQHQASVGMSIVGSAHRRRERESEAKSDFQEWTGD